MSSSPSPFTSPRSPCRSRSGCPPARPRCRISAARSRRPGPRRRTSGPPRSRTPRPPTTSSARTRLHVEAPASTSSNPSPFTSHGPEARPHPAPSSPSPCSRVNGCEGQPHIQQRVDAVTAPAPLEAVTVESIRSGSRGHGAARSERDRHGARLGLPASDFPEKLFSTIQNELGIAGERHRVHRQRPRTGVGQGERLRLRRHADRGIGQKRRATGATQVCSAAPRR